jgi:tetratricopeptide (TPR) repeat protein
MAIRLQGCGGYPVAGWARRPKGAASAVAFLATLSIGLAAARADTLSDCKGGAPPAVAVKACTALVEGSPGQEAEFEARYYRAGAYFRLLDLDKAHADLTSVIAARPRTANALAFRGDIDLRRGRHEAAMADLAAAIAINPTHATALATRGQLHTLKGNFPAAKADLDRAIALAPRQPRGYDRRGVMHRMMGNIDLALTDHNAAVAFGPTEPMYLMNRADVHVLRRAYDLAIADYDKVLSLNANYPRAKELRQSAIALKGSQTAAAPPSPPPPGFSPPRPPPPGPADAQTIDKLFAEADAHRKANRPDQAIATLTRVISLAPNSARALTERGQLHHFKNDFKNALVDLDRALAIDVNNVDAFFARGLVHADLGNVPRAIADCEAVLRLAPSDLRGSYCRGVANAKGRNWSAAIQELTKAINGTYGAAAYYWRGRCHLETDAYEAAGNDADKALALSPNWAGAVALKGNVLLARGEVDQALAEFERALRMQSNNLEAAIGQSAALIAKALQQHKSTRANKG